MHTKTLQIQRQIKRILSGLPETERRTVACELPEMIRSLTLSFEGATHPYPANLKVPPEAIYQLLKDKCDIAAGVLDNQTNYVNLNFCYDGVDKIGDGLKRVSFDFENHECALGARSGRYDNLLGPRHFGKIPGVGCAAGGDWEYPVFFVVYLDEDGQTLRAYVPKEGNVWNHKTNSAFGNNDASDGLFLENWAVENIRNIDKVAIARIGENPAEHAEIMFDEEQIVKDIENSLTTLESAR